MPHPHLHMSLFSPSDSLGSDKPSPPRHARDHDVAEPDRACVFSCGLFPPRNTSGMGMGRDGDRGGAPAHPVDALPAVQGRALRVRLQLPLSTRLIRHSRRAGSGEPEAASHGSSAGSGVGDAVDTAEVHVAVGDINVRYDAGLTRRLLRFIDYAGSPSEAPASEAPASDGGAAATASTTTGASAGVDAGAGAGTGAGAGAGAGARARAGVAANGFATGATGLGVDADLPTVSSSAMPSSSSSSSTMVEAEGAWRGVCRGGTGVEDLRGRFDGRGVAAAWLDAALLLALRGRFVAACRGAGLPCSACFKARSYTDCSVLAFAMKCGAWPFQNLGESAACQTKASTTRHGGMDRVGRTGGSCRT